MVLKRWDKFCRCPELCVVWYLMAASFGISAMSCHNVPLVVDVKFKNIWLSNICQGFHCKDICFLLVLIISGYDICKRCLISVSFSGNQQNSEHGDLLLMDEWQNRASKVYATMQALDKSFFLSFLFETLSDRGSNNDVSFHVIHSPNDCES